MSNDRPAADHARTGKRFLTAAAIGALNTANARKPFGRKGRLGTFGFMPGWLTSELPLHAIGWQAVATAGFVRKGALRTPAGWLGLGVSGASWYSLVKIWQQSMQAGAVYDDALIEGLGDELDAGREPMAPREEVELTQRRLVLGPIQNRRKGYVSGPSHSYGDAGPRNHLDIWKRPDLPLDAKAPVLVQVHGGGWVIGNKDQQAMPLMSHLADRGWVCVSINYRLSPRATWPDHIVDVKRALAWVKANIADHGGDPDFVAITGGSAGGHLSSLAALSANEPAFQPGFEEADTSVVAAVPFYGVYDWTNRDGTGLASMEDMLRAESKNPVAYAELPGAQHAFEVFDSPRTLYTSGAVHRFLEAIRVREGHVTHTPG